jgi:hypothetical protein
VQYSTLCKLNPLSSTTKMSHSVNRNSIGIKVQDVNEM